MAQSSAYGIRSVELAVRDLEATKAFYEAQWGLTEVARENGTVYMRATGKDHHVLTLHEAPRIKFLAINLGAKTRADVDALNAHAKALVASMSRTASSTLLIPYALDCAMGVSCEV